jgi:hypothetical protein
MKLTIKDLVLFYNLYDQIKDRAPSIKTAYKMNKIYERAAQEQTFIQEQQQKIAEKYAQRDEKGNLILTDDKTDILVEPSKMNECKKALRELVEIEVELPDYSFTLDELEPLKLSINDLQPLMNFICEK